MKYINVILFDNFTMLDVFGPIEVFTKLEKFHKIEFYSINGGVIKSGNLRIETLPVGEINNHDILLLPGGFGTRTLVNDNTFIQKLKELAEKSEAVLTVCTGSGLLAKTGLLKNIKATSNKMAFNWAVEQDKNVDWIRKARWVVCGKYYTSSGVTAGIDMTLGFINDKIGAEAAEKISNRLEYIWNRDKDDDMFA